MTNPYRAMCAELVDDLEMSDWPSKLKETFRADIARARALLAQPVAEGVLPLKERPDFIAGYGEGLADGRRIIEREEAERPTPQPPADGEAAELQRWGVDHGAQLGRPLLCPMEDGYWTPWHIANALLQRQHPQPVAVSKRLPGPEDCTAQGWCWVFYRGFATWTLEPPLGQDGKHTGYTHWLPANALPTPEAKP